MIPRYRVWDGQDNKMRIVEVLAFPSPSEVNVIIDGEAWALGPDLVLMQSTGFQDDQDHNIFIGDFTELIVDGEKRIFEVKNKQVIRKVKSHPSFIDEYAKVVLDAVVFVWKGFELFPCVDNAGIIDTSKMRIVGNIFETPELQKLR